jgi:hypothetical protein
MMLKPFKFLVQVVLIEEDEDGTIIGEQASQTHALYGLDALRRFADEFDAQMTALQNGRRPPEEE